MLLNFVVVAVVVVYVVVVVHAAIVYAAAGVAAAAAAVVVVVVVAYAAVVVPKMAQYGPKFASRWLEAGPMLALGPHHRTQIRVRSRPHSHLDAKTAHSPSKRAETVRKFVYGAVRTAIWTRKRPTRPASAPKPYANSCTGYWYW